MDTTNIGSQTIRNVILFISLVLVQVLVCNNILLFGVGVPMPFIYFIIALPLGLSLNLLLLVAFLMGFTVDLFSDTLGLNSMVCLLLAVLKKPVFYAYMPREDKNADLIPTLNTMGWESYIKFLITLSMIYCLLVFFIEFTSFAAFGRILVMSIVSALITMLLMLGIDTLASSSLRIHDR